MLFHLPNFPTVAPPGIVALHHVMYHHTNAMMNNVLRQVTEQMALRQTDAPTANSGDTYLRTAFAEVNAKLDVLLPDTTPIDLPLPEKLAGKLPCRTKADFHHFNNLMMEKNELFAETVGSYKLTSILQLTTSFVCVLN